MIPKNAVRNKKRRRGEQLSNISETIEEIEDDATREALERLVTNLYGERRGRQGRGSPESAAANDQRD